MRLLIIIALLFTVTPGLVEVAEAAVYLANGELPRHDELPYTDCTEHSCTPLAHHCGCHSTMAAQTSTVASRSISSTTSSKLPSVAIESGRVSEPPPLRPPIR